VGPVINQSGGIVDQVWYAVNIKGGANTVTVTYSSIISGGELMIHEYSGADTFAPLDVTASSTGNNTSPSSGPATTNFANELIFGHAVISGANSLFAGSTFNQRELNSADSSED